MENKLLTIFNTYGKSHQVSKLLEEVGEFIEAVMNEERNHIAEEISDVLVMLEQFRLYYDISDMKVKDIMINKIDRQINRIKEEQKRN